MTRYSFILLLLVLVSCKSRLFEASPPITDNDEAKSEVFWFTPEQQAPDSAREISDFEFIAEDKTLAGEAFNIIEAEAIKKGANLVYIERYTRPTVPAEYIFSIKGKYYQADTAALNVILKQRQLALDTCYCAYVYIYRNQIMEDDNYLPMNLIVNDQPIGGLANSKGYKLQVRLGEELELKSKGFGIPLIIDSVSGYRYIHFNSSKSVFNIEPSNRAVKYLLLNDSPVKYYKKAKDFQDRLLAESLYLERR